MTKFRFPYESTLTKNTGSTENTNTDKYFTKKEYEKFKQILYRSKDGISLVKGDTTLSHDNLYELVNIVDGKINKNDISSDYIILNDTNEYNWDFYKANEHRVPVRGQSFMEVELTRGKKETDILSLCMDISYYFSKKFEYNYTDTKNVFYITVSENDVAVPDKWYFSQLSKKKKSLIKNYGMPIAFKNGTVDRSYSLEGF